MKNKNEDEETDWKWIKSYLLTLGATIIIGFGILILMAIIIGKK